MKKFILMLTLLVFTVSVIGGSVFAWDRPYDEYYVPSGDDHPWGGEDAGPTPPRSGDTTITTLTTTTTYTLLSDIVLRFFIAHIYEAENVKVDAYQSEIKTENKSRTLSPAQHKAYLLEREGSR